MTTAVCSVLNFTLSIRFFGENWCRVTVHWVACSFFFSLSVGSQPACLPCGQVMAEIPQKLSSFYYSILWTCRLQNAVIGLVQARIPDWVGPAHPGTPTGAGPENGRTIPLNYLSILGLFN